ncbi:ribulose-phosphate 3-epimerase [Candidatus Pelagibacter sp.]|nr:ribulose-phosphate 3-epimerase [Candidatus Pelagibacter sp.]|tara:strand:+ start:473 stop:1132 length:660 start_codon:yes stop_codon:yes gene_type:complete
MKKIQVSPSILSANFSKLGEDIKRLEQNGADMIHVDVMDGHFVPNLTIGPPVIKSLRKYTKLPFDVHLMIDPVHKYIKDYSDAGADIITFHPEATENILETIDLIKSLDKKVGISLNPDTEITAAEEHLDKIDLVLIMSVYPGFGGQTFINKVVKKVEDLDQIRKERKLNFKIEIDGGINFETSKIAVEAGVDILVSGTTVFKENNGDLKKNIKTLKQI